ncbi:hypothetical protein KA005_42320 [bacterium]|nr:hypothetical protein [bacterium]
MLTEKDKEWLRGQKWKMKDIEMFEEELKKHKVREPYVIRSSEGFIPLAEVWRVGGEQCLHIF